AGEGDRAHRPIDRNDASPHVQIETAIARSAGWLDGALEGGEQSGIVGQSSAIGHIGASAERRADQHGNNDTSGPNQFASHGFALQSLKDRALPRRYAAS